MRDFFVERVIAPLAAAPSTVIDGVFFDCFNFAYQLPSPWNRHATNVANCSVGKGGPGCEALLAGTIDLARRVALALNRGGKVAMYSNPASFVNPKGAGAPFWLDEARLLDGLQGTSVLFNYEFVRAEVPTQGPKPTTSSLARRSSALRAQWWTGAALVRPARQHARGGASRRRVRRAHIPAQCDRGCHAAPRRLSRRARRRDRRRRVHAFCLCVCFSPPRPSSLAERCG